MHNNEKLQTGQPAHHLDPCLDPCLDPSGRYWQYMQGMLNEQERLRAQARASILKALAHPTRVYIVDLISREGAHCVCELTDRIGADTSTVSRHLSLLRNAGLLYDRKEGTTVYYDLTCDCISDFMNGLESVLRARHKREQVAFAASVGQ